MRMLSVGLLRAVSTLMSGDINNLSIAAGSLSSSSHAWPASWNDERVKQMLVGQFRSGVPKVLFSLCQLSGGALWAVNFQQFCCICRLIKNTEPEAGAVYHSCSSSTNTEMELVSPKLASMYEINANTLLFILRYDGIVKVS